MVRSKPETLHTVFKYNHKNPVRHGLVEKPMDWLWSSSWYDGRERRLPPEIGPSPSLDG